MRAGGSAWTVAEGRVGQWTEMREGKGISRTLRK